VRLLREGDFFGEVSILSGRPRTATITAHRNAPLSWPAHRFDLKRTRARLEVLKRSSTSGPTAPRRPWRATWSAGRQRPPSQPAARLFDHRAAIRRPRDAGCARIAQRRNGGTGSMDPESRPCFQSVRRSGRGTTLAGRA
jgi:hypothetical protein